MIIGEEVQLIPLNDECFELILKWVNNPEQRRLTGTRFPVSKIEHEIWFKEKAMDKYNKTYAIQSKETNEIIGLVGNKDYDVINRSTCPFIFIGETGLRGKGLGTEALLLFSEFCFNELNVHKLFAYIYDYNMVSRKLFEKCGYVLEGILKLHWYKDGTYHDVLIMGRFKDETK